MGRRFPSKAKAHPLNISLLRSPCNACLPTIAATLGFAGGVVGRLETLAHPPCGLSPTRPATSAAAG